MGDIIFLWNKERILIEGLELSQLKISQELGLEKNVVHAQYVSKDGKIMPDFNIDQNDIPDDYLGDVGELISRVWSGVKAGINEKLEHIND